MFVCLCVFVGVFGVWVCYVRVCFSRCSPPPFSFGLSHLGGDDEKVSAFFSLMKLLLEDTQERQYSLEECFACFKRLLLQHSVHRPPFSVEVFSQEDVENITSYVLHR